MEEDRLETVINLLVKVLDTIGEEDYPDDWQAHDARAEIYKAMDKAEWLRIAIEDKQLGYTAEDNTYNIN